MVLFTRAERRSVKVPEKVTTVVTTAAITNSCLSSRTWRVIPVVLIKVPGDKVVQDGVAQELQPLVAVGQAVGIVGGVSEGLGEINRI